ncbi:MAG: CRISPR-associated protein Cas5 [Nitrospirae bacterium]|nr:CRISPR-associated protein Cas5 [Nitrospirota bacterium]
MKALVFDIRVNSLYSIRIPFTWQSSLTYPVLPPSAVIGMLANALQRYKNNKHPLEYLDLIENDLLWAGSRLLTPCVIKSYTTSAIVKWEYKLGGKFTNALGRQYAYSKKLQIAAIFKNDTLLNDIAEALKASPLTCGDSESPISLDSEVSIKDVAEDIKDESIQTKYPVPFTKDTKIEDGNGQVYLMHERCKKSGNNFPLVSYMVPMREESKIIYPSTITIRVSNEKVFRIEETGDVVAKPTIIESEDAKDQRRKGKKRKDAKR